MSRDVLIATVTTIIFVSSIGGALWYGGYTTTLAKLTSLEEFLPASEPKPKPPATESNSSGELPRNRWTCPRVCRPPRRKPSLPTR